MKPRTLNLIYANSKLNFFSQLETMRSIILEFKKDKEANEFSAKDEAEVGRGSSYAIFPELQALVDSGQNITLAALRASLKTRGIQDELFQNKIMALLLQGKAGLQFAAGNVITTALLESGHTFLMDPDYNVRLEVKNKNHAKLIFSGAWKNYTEEPYETGFNAQIEINITPKRVAIDSLKITQIGQKKSDFAAFDFLKKNQVSLWSKFIIALRTFFNINQTVEIENEARDKTSWGQNSTQ